jgi:putative aldouronate transport system substrate-binding protein
MSKRILALLLALALVVSVFAACGDSGNSSSSGGNSSTASTESGDASSAGEDEGEPSNVSAGPDDTSEHYAFTCYWYYDWAQLKEWGGDAVSAYWADKFNVDVEFSMPDADPDSKLNIMLTGGDLPDSMILDRGRVLNSVARAGALQEIEQFMYPGCSFETDVAEIAKELQKVDGKLYGIPNWPRGEGAVATGGNYGWIINTDTYKKVGSPKLETMDDLHDYCVKVKEANLTSYTGQSIIPFATTNTNNGFYVYQQFYRSLGARNLVENYFTQENSKLEICVREPLFVEALKMANQWYNEGLWSSEEFTDDGPMWEEKMTNGRPALMFYDFSQDDSNNFRRITREKSNGEVSYEVLGDPNSEITKDFPMWPKANKDVKVCYGDENGTVGWNVNVITTSAKRPQRIFDLFTYLISEEGTREVCYGPEGGLWEGIDENGIPQLTKPYADITSDEMNAAGAWLWTQPASSDWMDSIKFAVNAQQDPDKRSWVVSIQSDLFSQSRENPHEGTKFITDQNTGLTNLIDPQSDEGIQLKAIQDELQVRLPQILMAKDEAEFDKLLEEAVQTVESNNIDGILAIWQEQYDKNIELQGFDAYDPAHISEVYGMDLS